MNAAWYLYTFDDRGMLAVLLLTDGRFAFLCEAIVSGSVESRARIYSRCIFASSLQQLVFFALADVDRRDLGIDIGIPLPLQKPVLSNKLLLNYQYSYSSA